MLLACGREEAGRIVLARRPTADQVAEMLDPCDGAPARDDFCPLCVWRRDNEEEGEEVLLPFPGLPPGRAVRMPGAPKLIRRTKGVLGAVLAAPDHISSSSMALSSIESDVLELVDRLPRRMLKG